MYEEGEKTIEISRLTGFTESTLRMIKRNRNSIEALASIWGNTKNISICNRKAEIQQVVENKQASWISDRIEGGCSVTYSICSLKAQSLYNRLAEDYAIEKLPKGGI